MRGEPDAVPPIIHDGVRYSAPHWHDFDDTAVANNDAFMRRLEHIAQTTQQVEQPCERVRDAIKRVTAAQMQARMMAMINDGFGDLDAPDNKDDAMGFMEALINPKGMDVELAKAGLAPDEIASATKFLEAQLAQQRNMSAMWDAEMTPPSPSARHQNGGIVVACNATTEEELWTVRVFRTADDEEDVFITALAVEDGKLVVRDERGRTHRLDLATGALQP